MKTASDNFWGGDEIVKKALRTKKTGMSNYITLSWKWADGGDGEGEGGF